MPPDGWRYELVHGELRKMGPAGNEHGQIAARVLWRLARHVETNCLGVVFAAETGFLIGRAPDTVRAPDVAFVSQSRLEEVGQVEGYWPGAPDLVVEVVSPTDRDKDVKEKTSDWLEAGTRMVLIVDPRKRIVTVYRSLHEIAILNSCDMLSGEDVVPGWQVAVSEIFG